MVARAIFLLLALLVSGCGGLERAPAVAADAVPSAGEASAGPTRCMPPDRLAVIMLGSTPSAVVAMDLAGAAAAPYLANLSTKLSSGPATLAASRVADRVIGVVVPGTNVLFLIVGSRDCVVLGVQITGAPPGDPV